MDHATVRLLKDRFDLADGEAEHILGSFVEAVERNLEEFGICHVTGVGSFVRAPGDSRISFEPAEALRRAVNVRFADLSVYEIDPGATPQPEAETLDGELPAAESRVTDPSRAASPPSDPLPSEPSPSDRSDAHRPPLAGIRTPHKRRQKSSGGSKAVWFVLPLVIALVAAGVWYMQRPASDPAPVAEETAPASPEAGANAVPETGEPAPPEAIDDRAQAETDLPADAEPQEQQDAAIAADDVAAPETRLDRTIDGYTMIVGSSPDRTSADEQISRFTELDLPYGVLDYSEDDSPMYRLAVGLFDSAEQADSARQAMADTLPSGTWVWRIR